MATGDKSGVRKKVAPTVTGRKR